MKGTVKKEGSTWKYHVYIGNDPKTGKRIYKHKRGFKTKKECEIALAQVITSTENGLLVNSSNIPLKSYLKYWIDEYAKKNCSSTTLTRYKEYYVMINKYLGKTPLNKISIPNIEKLYSILKEDEGYHNNTIITMSNMLHIALKHAVKWQLIATNPCDYSDKPKRIKNEMTYWNIKDIPNYLEKLKKEPIYNLIYLGVYTGARLGELCALTWKDINFKDNTLKINKSMFLENSKLKTKEPKTQKSNRIVVLFPHVIDFLKDLKKNQIVFNIDNFILINELNQPVYTKYVSRTFKRALMKYDIPVIRFHDLRHSYATMLLQAGVNIKTISQMLGHSDISTTLNIYSHVDLEMQKNELKKVSEKLKLL